ncbi:MAG: hypothetical protein Q7J54_04900 [Candidatus Woesearchaeota archaeon]|nr:hypothetical protein [Candidatus Woesearchaeota archaeon]
MVSIDVYKAKYSGKKEDWQSTYYADSDEASCFTSYLKGDTLRELAENLPKIPVDYTRGVFEINYSPPFHTKVSSGGIIKLKHLNLLERRIFEYYLSKNLRKEG